MVSAGRLPPTEDTLFHASNLEKARAHLKEFPLVQSLVDNLDHCKGPDKIRNIFFALCLNGDPALSEFERFLADFEILNLPRDKLREYKGKAAQNNWQSLSALAEGLVARHYQLKVGIEKVEFHPALQPRGTGDLSVKT